MFSQSGLFGSFQPNPRGNNPPLYREFTQQNGNRPSGQFAGLYQSAAKPREIIIPEPKAQGQGQDLGNIGDIFQSKMLTKRSIPIEQETKAQQVLIGEKMLPQPVNKVNLKARIIQTYDQLIGIIESLEDQLKVSKELEIFYHKLKYFESGDKDYVLNKLKQEFTQSILLMEQIIEDQEVQLLELNKLASQTPTSNDQLYNKSLNISSMTDNMTKLEKFVRDLNDESEQLLYEISRIPPMEESQPEYMGCLREYVNAMMIIQGKINTLKSNNLQ